MKYIMLLLILNGCLFSAESRFVNVLYPKNPTVLTEFEFNDNDKNCVVQCVKSSNLTVWRKQHPNIYIVCVEVFNAKDRDTSFNEVFFIISYYYKPLELEK